MEETIQTEGINLNKYYVYMHTSPSNKKYIGITSKNPPSDRWKNGNGYSHNKHFSNAIKKYGWENFKHEILFSDLSYEEATSKEIELIAYYKSNIDKYGYNKTTGGEVGKKLSEESIEKMRTNSINVWKDPDYRSRNMAHRPHLAGELSPKYGKSLSEETKKRIAEKIGFMDY